MPIDSHEVFCATRIALKLECRVIDVIRVVQASFNCTAYLGSMAHRDIIDVNMCFKVNVGIVHLPQVDVVNVLHARNTLARCTSLMSISGGVDIIITSTDSFAISYVSLRM